MKKILLLLLFVFNLCVDAFAQKIESDKTDEFDGHRMIRTKYEKIAKSPTLESFAAAFVIKANALLDTSLTLYFAFTSSDVTSIDDDREISFKLSNDSVIKYNNQSKYKIFSTGDRIIMYCWPEMDFIKILQSSKITKIRFQTSQKNYDFDIKADDSDLIYRSLMMVADAVKKPK